MREILKFRLKANLRQQAAALEAARREARDLTAAASAAVERLQDEFDGLASSYDAAVIRERYRHPDALS